MPYLLRNKDDISLMRCSTSRFQKSFSPSSIYGWNSLSLPIRNSSTLSKFKVSVKRLFCKKKFPKLFEIGARYSSVLHTWLRLKNQSTWNDDLFRHNCISSPACARGYHRETIKHYLLDSPRYEAFRIRLFTSAAECLLFSYRSYFVELLMLILIQTVNYFSLFRNLLLIHLASPFVCNDYRKINILILFIDISMYPHIFLYKL